MLPVLNPLLYINACVPQLSAQWSHRVIEQRSLLCGPGFEASCRHIQIDFFMALIEQCVDMSLMNKPNHDLSHPMKSLAILKVINSHPIKIIATI